MCTVANWVHGRSQAHQGKGRPSRSSRRSGHRAEGHKIAIPYGEDWDYDLIVCRHGALERVQAKYTESDGRVIEVKCFSASLTGGKVRSIKRYTASTVDWIAVYDATTQRCYYVSSSEFSEGKTYLHLRLAPPRNNQRRGIRFAEDYLTF
ncbi:MAG: group I intron-associated PD-(D/E)XK endonuclease [Thermoleophilaceae bacterium]